MNANKSIDQVMGPHAARLVSYLDRHFEERENLTGQMELMKAMRYSLLQEGGKRFRPVLSQLTAEALGQAPDRALPFGAAIECIHTYSLIHDDLPAMDNDDFRRGQPTSHKVFGEATAILAGDALLTEAFTILAHAYSQDPALAVKLVSLTAEAAGHVGMVGGQAIDIGAKRDQLTFDDLRTMHRLKTGALIRASVRGAALACAASETELSHLTKFGEAIGFAFQVADDLLDSTPEKPEAGSFPELIGYGKTRTLLEELTETCLQSLTSFGAAAESLRAIARYNRDRSF